MALHTIDPQIWTDDGFFFMSVPAKLMYLGFISIADDQGRIRIHRGLLRSRLFSGDDISPEQIDGWVEELVKARLIIRYTVDDKDYAQIRDWWWQQSISRPEPSEHPAPPGWKDRAGYVYLVHDGELYKIGISTQPDKRRQQLKYQNGRECKILVLIEREDYRELETRLHEKFTDKRVKGEWFDLAPDDVAWIASLADTGDE